MAPTQTTTPAPADMIVYELSWVLAMCCIEESQIKETIPPVAEFLASLGMGVSNVGIASWTAFDPSEGRRAEVITKTLRRVSSVTDGAWDIEYLLQVAGMNNALNVEIKLEDATFVNQIGDSISTSMDFALDSIFTRDVFFLETSVLITSSPSEELAASQQTTFSSTTAQPLIIVVIVGIGFLVISICALKFDYKAILMDRIKPLHSRLLPSSI